MNEATANKLIALNRRFYQNLAAPFSATRGRLQMGVLKLIERIERDARVLDLGCGNGELALELERRGHQGPYVGVDFSEALLQIAREKNYANSKARFIQADLTSSDFDQTSTIAKQQFDAILCFASLHHIPGQEMRLDFLGKVGDLLAEDGQFMLSNWQFLNSGRLRKRIQAWERAGLSQADVDAGDYLLDWRSGGEGLRYAHQFSAAELAELANASGFAVQESFYSDGGTGDLGLYGLWVKLFGSGR